LVTRKILVNGLEVAPAVNDDWSAVEVQPNLWSVLIGGRSHEVFLGPDGRLAVDGEPQTVEVVDPRAVRRRGPAGNVEGRQMLKAAMPGKVVRVLVVEGSEVQAGQGVLVVEAMKMQNELKSPKSGIVTRVAVQEGATVNAGDLLAVVE
jgi:biotin carboxyl carrier protein